MNKYKNILISILFALSVHQTAHAQAKDIRPSSSSPQKPVTTLQSTKTGSTSTAQPAKTVSLPEKPVVRSDVIVSKPTIQLPNTCPSSAATQELSYYVGSIAAFSSEEPKIEYLLTSGSGVTQYRDPRSALPLPEVQANYAKQAFFDLDYFNSVKLQVVIRPDINTPCPAQALLTYQMKYVSPTGDQYLPASKLSLPHALTFAGNRCVYSGSLDNQTLTAMTSQINGSEKHFDLIGQFCAADSQDKWEGWFQLSTSAGNGSSQNGPSLGFNEYYGTTSDTPILFRASNKSEPKPASLSFH